MNLLLVVTMLVGSFNLCQTLPGNYGMTIDSGDLNRDGKTDLVVGNYSSVYVYFDSCGHLVAKDSFFNCCQAVRVCDVNRDGNPDIIAKSINFPNPAVQVLLGDGQGNFRVGPSFGEGDAAHFYTADFNGDGIPDLLQCGQALTPSVVYLGQGDGTFQVSQVFTFADIGNCPSAAIADVNRNGHLAIIFAQWPENPGKFSQVWLGDGLGHFVLGQLLDTISTTDVACGDLNKDGYPDLVFGHDDWGHAPLTIWYGDAQGQFTKSSVQLGSYYCHVVRLADINGDGWLEVIQGNTGDSGFDTRTRAYYNHSGSFQDGDTGTVITFRQARTNDLLVGHLDGDSVLYLVQVTWFDAGGGADSIYIYREAPEAIAEVQEPKVNAYCSVSSNPFRDRLEVRLAMPESSPQFLPIRDVTGRQVGEVKIAAGQKTGVYDASKLSAGVYVLATPVGQRKLVKL